MKKNVYYTGKLYGMTGMERVLVQNNVFMECWQM